MKLKLTITIIFCAVLMGCETSATNNVANKPLNISGSDSSSNSNTNNSTVLVNTQSITNTNTINSNNAATISNEDNETFPKSWDERAYDFVIDEYMKNRLVQCGDSYFLLLGKANLYQTKTYPSIDIQGNVIPEDVLSEADKLNNKKPLPERWKGKITVQILGPWHNYDGKQWNGWRDDPAWERKASLEFTPEGKWFVTGEWYTGKPIYEKIGEYKCVGDNIDVLSIPD